MKHIKPTTDIPGFWEPLEVPSLEGSEFSECGDNETLLLDLLSITDIQKLNTFFDSAPFKSPVGVDGYSTSSGIGSYRSSVWSEKLAGEFSKLFNKVLSLKLMELDDYSRTDVTDGIWEFKEVSPLLRFMEYRNGGRHNTHYDRGYRYNDEMFTLKSFVLYLTTNEDGNTRFIEDYQDEIPQVYRNNDDWTREALDYEVLKSFTPFAGDCLVFNHRMAHDVQKFSSEIRRIIRGDLIYNRIG